MRKQVSDVTYVIEVERGRHALLHINQLKPYVRRAEHLVCFTQGEESRSHGVEEGIPLLTEIFQGNDEEDFRELKDKVASSELLDSQKQDLHRLLDNHRQVFSNKPGCTNLVEYSLELTDSDPVRIRAYPVNPKAKEVMRGEINKLVEQGLLVPVISDYAAPIFFI